MLEIPEYKESSGEELSFIHEEIHDIEKAFNDHVERDEKGDYTEEDDDYFLLIYVLYKTLVEQSKILKKK